MFFFYRTILSMADSENVMIMRIYIDDLARVSLQSGFTRRTFTSYAWQIPRGQWTHVACTVSIGSGTGSRSPIRQWQIQDFPEGRQSEGGPTDNPGSTLTMIDT